MADLVDEVVGLYQRVQRLESRSANAVRHGTTAEVDTAKGLFRARIGGDDDAPFLSPWIPYSQMAGAIKGHAPPSIGQPVTLLSPGGDLRQAVGYPFTWSDENPSPGSGADPVWTYGAVKIEVTTSGITVSVGGASIKLSADEFLMTAQLVKAVGSTLQHNEKSVGDTHLHGGILPGPANTDVPV